MLGVTVVRCESSAITLRAAVRAASAPPAHAVFQISNFEPSASCVANSGLSREKVFVKGAGHQRRLCSDDPQLQQWPLY